MSDRPTLPPLLAPSPMRPAIKKAAAALVILIAIGGAASDPSHLVLYPLMKGEIVREAQRIWDLAGQARDAEGRPDATRLTPADWQAVAAAARKMGRAATDLAEAPTIDVVGSGAELDGGASPNAPTPAELDRYIAAHRREFSDRARALSLVADAVQRASAARDIRQLSDASNRLDDACAACHLQFKYSDTARPDPAR